MAFPMEVTEISPQTTLIMHATMPVGDLPKRLGGIFGRVAQVIEHQGLTFAGPPFVAYHNMDMNALEMEIGFPVQGSPRAEDDVVPGRIDGGLVATCLHTGPYADIGPAYDALTAYLEKQGLDPATTVYEFYLNDPQEVSPAELQTLIQMPVSRNSTG